MKKVLLSCLALICGTLAMAQDVHFSQYNASPLTLNPALTGKLECNYRAAINYRNQWNQIPAPYVTISAAGDAALLKGRLNGDALGVGLKLMNDVSGDGNLQEFHIGFMTAYHLAVSKNSILSLGVEGEYVQKGIDFNKLLWGDQIDAGGPTGTPTGEVLGTEDFQYGNINAGLHFSSIVSRTFSFNVGTALYNIVEPEETFEIKNDPSPNNRRARRFVFHGGASAAIGDQWSISPSFLVMKQTEQLEVNVGAAAGYHMEEASVYFGGFARTGDAFNALFGLGISDLLIGISYDITYSDLAAANNNRGGFEMSLSYNGCIEAKQRIIHCPHF